MCSPKCLCFRHQCSKRSLSVSISKISAHARTRTNSLLVYFETEGHGFESQPWRNFLRQEIDPYCAALDPGEVNGCPVGFIP